MITIVNEQVGQTVLASAILIGQAFTGTVGQFTGLFLRTFDGIVLLNNPKKTWHANTTTIEVLDYVPVDLKIIVQRAA